MSEGGPAYAGVLGIWTAGMPPYVFPDGVGRRFGSTVRVVVDQHYHPIGDATRDASKIGLHFGEGELEKEVMTIPVTNTGLRIPPGAGHHAENAHYLFDKDVQILAFSPHMHVRGKAMSYELTYPDGSKEMLLDVPKYDYNWQWLYYPTKPVDIPAGSRLDVTAVWDNSVENPANPDPTKEIIYRGDTFSEMFNASSRSSKRTASSSNCRSRSSRSSTCSPCTRRRIPTRPEASWAFTFRAKARDGSTWAASTPSSSTTSSGRATSSRSPRSSRPSTRAPRRR